MKSEFDLKSELAKAILTSMAKQKSEQGGKVFSSSKKEMSWYKTTYTLFVYMWNCIVKLQSPGEAEALPGQQRLRMNALEEQEEQFHFDHITPSWEGAQCCTEKPHPGPMLLQWEKENTRWISSFPSITGRFLAGSLRSYLTGITWRICRAQLLGFR